MQKVTRDDTYYLEDGSCILQVEDVLFNVHRTILSKDSSLFSSMFSLPQTGEIIEGRSDAHPIILHGDTVSEFKSFLWLVIQFSIPHELMAIHSPKGDLDRLMAIARVSFKYHFKSLETWALDAINDHVISKESPMLVFAGIGNFPGPAVTTFNSSATFSAHRNQVSKLVRLAQLCGHEKLLNTMITLLRRLMSGSIQYAHLAMTLADELDIRALRGIAYLEVMHKAVVVAKSAPGSGSDRIYGESEDNETEIVDAEGRLIVTREQQLRLLTGYYRLTREWEKIRLMPIMFEHAGTCGATWHQHGCPQSWTDFWKEKTKCDSVMNLGLADLLGRLRAMSKEFDRWGSANYMHHECRVTARRAIQDKIRSIEETLPNYFMDDET
ncbi:hypothetical protein C8Q75DRAFT_717809 [Abortiporus biennis]|nr:hypothetical protein C8Q75DRAFT_717809 [Abortiporus biennis]